MALGPRRRVRFDIDLSIGKIATGYRALANVATEAAPVCSALAQTRRTAGASQYDLAAELGVGQPTVSGWETGTQRVPPHVASQWRELCARAARRRTKAMVGGPGAEGL